MTFLRKQNETTDLLDIEFLGLVGVVLDPQIITDLIQELSETKGRSVSVHSAKYDPFTGDYRAKC